MSTTESAIDMLGRFDRVETNDVPVDAQRRALVRMAQDLGCCGRISAGAQDEGRRGVPESCRRVVGSFALRARRPKALVCEAIA